jgi:hypothetical protein
MNWWFTLISAVMGAMACSALHLTLVEYITVLVITNMIWSVICHYKNWFLDI